MSETEPRPEPQPVHGTSVMPSLEAVANAPEAALGAPSAPAFGSEYPEYPAEYGAEYAPEYSEGYVQEYPPEYAQEYVQEYPQEYQQTFGADLPAEVSQPMGIPDEEDDGLPGGQIPSSSGFSWRLPGTPAAAPVAQGGIPNEFDHLFRDSGAESRRSLMPGQIMPGQSASQAASQAALSGQGQAGAGYGGAGGPGRPGPAGTEIYRPEQPVQDARPQDGYPQQPYLGESGGAYDHDYRPGQVPVGAPADEAHTQALPRVPVQYGQPGQPGAGNPDLLLGTGPTKGSANRTMLMAVGVLAVLVAVAMFAFSGSGDSKKHTAKPAADAGTPSSSAAANVDPAAKEQADAIYAVIQQSQGLTGKASGAISAVTKCGDVQGAVQTFTDVADKRQAQADAVASLSADKLPGGANLLQHLQQAWQYSATSERELAAWAQDNVGCTGKPGNNDNRKKADSDGNRAGTAKATAADEWNAAAAKAGQPTIKKTEL